MQRETLISFLARFYTLCRAKTVLYGRIVEDSEDRALGIDPNSVYALYTLI